MRSILFSSALVFATVACNGCATIRVDQGCDVDQACAEATDCGKGRVGGILGRLRGERSCQDCGNQNCQSGDCGDANGGAAAGGFGSGGFGSGGNAIGAGRMGAGRMGAGMTGGRMGAGIGGRGLAGGFGRGGACGTCGMLGGGCRCGLGNHAPYTPAFNGPPGPQTGHYSYPYYTTRAPRDFLMANPPSIGR